MSCELACALAAPWVLGSGGAACVLLGGVALTGTPDHAEAYPTSPAPRRRHRRRRRRQRRRWAAAPDGGGGDGGGGGGRGGGVVVGAEKGKLE